LGKTSSIILKNKRSQGYRSIQTGTAWPVSVPGDMVVTVEALPWSTFPDELRDNGYPLWPEGKGRRILAHAIVEHFGRAADGTLVPITQGSTLRKTNP
jgi:hypothetical protein